MHISVLKKEVISYLKIKKDGTYLDLTGGRGGHSMAILKNLSKNGKLFIFDQDEFAFQNLINLFKDYPNVSVINDNFRNISNYFNEPIFDGILFDLGMSSDQIDNPERGFSYLFENTLDMRMSKNIKSTALEILNTIDKKILTKIFYEYGEIKKAPLISSEIIKQRPIINSSMIVKICDKYKEGKGHSAKKVFQALRIYVNDEINALKEMLNYLPNIINQKGIICGITFHSLEDKIVKNFFSNLTKIKINKYSPIQIESEKDFVLLTNKGIKPSVKEINENKRSKSAILRAVMKK